VPPSMGFSGILDRIQPQLRRLTVAIENKATSCSDTLRQTALFVGLPWHYPQMPMELQGMLNEQKRTFADIDIIRIPKGFQRIARAHDERFLMAEYRDQMSKGYYFFAVNSARYMFDKGMIGSRITYKRSLKALYNYYVKGGNLELAIGVTEQMKQFEEMRKEATRLEKALMLAIYNRNMADSKYDFAIDTARRMREKGFGEAMEFMRKAYVAQHERQIDNGEYLHAIDTAHAMLAIEISEGQALLKQALFLRLYEVVGQGYRHDALRIAEELERLGVPEKPEELVLAVEKEVRNKGDQKPT